VSMTWREIGQACITYSPRQRMPFKSLNEGSKALDDMAGNGPGIYLFVPAREVHRVGMRHGAQGVAAQVEFDSKF